MDCKSLVLEGGINRKPQLIGPKFPTLTGRGDWEELQVTVMPSGHLPFTAPESQVVLSPVMETKCSQLVQPDNLLGISQQP